jgi:mannose-6-phosphate isomerase-like protein (cupin superfamily)
MSGYRFVTRPTRIPVPGDKIIEELFGRVNTGTEGFSLAHMVAPVGWSEPAQTPDFGELTIMMRGRIRVEIDGDVVDVEAGQAIWCEPGHGVRYSNPFPEENEYFALCLPAFSPDTAHRDE